MRWTRSLAFALVAIVGVALIATGYGVAQLTSVETEVRVVARPHEDGRVEFAVQQRVGGEWGERIAPSSRYLTPRLIEERVGRWLNSSPITLTVAVESGELTEATDSGSTSDSDDERTRTPPASGYEPVIASNFDTAPARTTLWYNARQDAFTDGVRTDVRMVGPDGNLTMDAVCFAEGRGVVGFRLRYFTRSEREAADVPEQLEVLWRLNAGAVQRETLDVEFLGNTPAVYFRGTNPGFDQDWPDALRGGSLAVRIEHRGVHEDVFNLDAFAETPVHQNLVNCGSY